MIALTEAVVSTSPHRLSVMRDCTKPVHCPGGARHVSLGQSRRRVQRSIGDPTRAGQHRELRISTGSLPLAGPWPADAVSLRCSRPSSHVAPPPETSVYRYARLYRVPWTANSCPCPCRSSTYPRSCRRSSPSDACPIRKSHSGNNAIVSAGASRLRVRRPTAHQRTSRNASTSACVASIAGIRSCSSNHGPTTANSSARRSGAVR